MKKLHIKKDDFVVVISGNAKGKTGKVLAVSPEEGKVMVEGANKVKKHQKARRQGEISQIIETEGALYASKVQLYCDACKIGVRTKIKTSTDKNGKTVKTRVCAKCGKEL